METEVGKELVAVMELLGECRNEDSEDELREMGLELPYKKGGSVVKYLTIYGDLIAVKTKDKITPQDAKSLSKHLSYTSVEFFNEVSGKYGVIASTLDRDTIREEVAVKRMMVEVEKLARQKLSFIAKILFEMTQGEKEQGFIDQMWGEQLYDLFKAYTKLKEAESRVNKMVEETPSLREKIGSERIPDLSLMMYYFLTSIEFEKLPPQTRDTVKEVVWETIGFSLDTAEQPKPKKGRTM